ncbi:MAG: hypothetical protein ACQXXH_01950 [Candidatus Bathyarchaeia archaeon]|jgi:hypothetical protein|nr:hypothetical protein [Candidatus Bathyarchaeota archaeon A05DMB-4]MDH7594509.1 hypothetical protein [Candidatus Bathyarchaeota archaeon]
MKTVTLIVRHRDLSRMFPGGLELVLEDDACVLDAIKAVDAEVRKRCGSFPVKGFQSLLQMVYHPKEERFYKQTSINVQTREKQFLNVKANPRLSLPDGTIVILIPEGGCITDWEEQVK